MTSGVLRSDSSLYWPSQTDLIPDLVFTSEETHSTHYNGPSVGITEVSLSRTPGQTIIMYISAWVAAMVMLALGPLKFAENT